MQCEMNVMHVLYVSVFRMIGMFAEKGMQVYASNVCNVCNVWHVEYAF